MMSASRNVVLNNEVSFSFGNSSRTFSPGSAINGSVSFTFVFPRQIRSIYLDFNGTASTSHTKKMDVRNENGNFEKKEVGQTGKQLLIQKTVYIRGAPNQMSAETIPDGHYSFPFDFQLPTNMPPSYAAKFGKIEYNVMLTIEKGDGSKEVTKEPFTVVVPPVDLRPQRELFDDYVLPMQTSFCWLLCCCGGDLEMSVSIPRRAYSPGEKIQMLIECSNMSKVKIEAIQYALWRYTKYHFQFPRDDTYTQADQIAMGQTAPVAKQSAENTFRPELLVPSSLQAINLTHCKIIEISFEIMIKVVFNGPYFALIRQIPISIGNVHEGYIDSLDFGATTPPPYPGSPSAPLLKE